MHAQKMPFSLDTDTHCLSIKIKINGLKYAIFTVLQQAILGKGYVSCVIMRNIA